MNTDTSFLGTGWSFPPQFNRVAAQGGTQVEMVSGEVDVKQSLDIILATQPGERLMNPGFGCELSQFVFEEVRQGTITRIKDVITDAFLYYEPRIEVNDIDITTSQDNVGLLFISIDYTIRQVNSRFNLVYPFYLNEGAAIFQNPL